MALALNCLNVASVEWPRSLLGEWANPQCCTEFVAVDMQPSHKLSLSRSGNVTLYASGFNCPTSLFQQCVCTSVYSFTVVAVRRSWELFKSASHESNLQPCCRRAIMSDWPSL
jgi:hypothetical protein